MGEACAALRAKARLAAATLRASMLSRLVRAWRATAAADRLDREAAKHLEERMRQQRQIVLATAHWDQRRSRRIWFAWRAFLRHARNERMKEMLHLRAQQFILEEANIQRASEEAALQSPWGSVPNIAEVEDCEPADGPCLPSGACDIAVEPPISPMPNRDSPSVAESAKAAAKCQLPKASAEKSSRSASASASTPSRSVDEQASPKRCAKLRRPKLVVEMERRAEERRRVREERLQRQCQQEQQQQPSDVQAVEGSPVRRPEVQRSKLVLKMERRAEELTVCEKSVANGISKGRNSGWPRSKLQRRHDWRQRRRKRDVRSLSNGNSNV